MDHDRSRQPFGDFESTSGGLSPHLADYWQILSRRLWLVLLVFAVTTATAIWAVSRQPTQYQAVISLQVNDPLQRTRALNPTARISSMEIFVDPIESEIQVLTSGTISKEVVDSLGLRLAPSSPELVQSDLFRDAWVDSLAQPGSLELVYDEMGGTVSLRRLDGPLLVSGPVGIPLNGGFLRFTPTPPPGEDRAYGVQILPLAAAVEGVRGRISAVAREYTNLIDASFVSADPVMGPLILVRAAEALRRHGAMKVSTAARNEVAFIEQELARARVQLRASLEAIQAFKETQAFTSLSIQEQALVNEAQELTREIETLADQREILSRMARDMASRGAEGMDLVEMAASLPEGSNPRIAELIDGIRSDQEGFRTLIQERRVTADHPSARAIRARIAGREDGLLEALRASLRVVEARLLSLQEDQEDLRRRQRAFPLLENQLQTLELDQETDQVTYEYLLSQLYQARIMEAAAEPYVDILDRPVGASEVDPRGRMNIILGAILGLILGAGGAFFLEYLDRTIRTTADVESYLGIPVLGVIPRLRRLAEAQGKAGEHPAGPLLVVASDPAEPAAEAYRNLRLNLMFMSTPEDPIRTVVFTSPGPNEGKSTSALNLAVMLAQQGQRVLLLDTDLRRPSLHRALDVLREPGLTNLLVGDAEIREAVRPNVLPNLDFLPSGPFPPNPSELLNSKAMERLLEALGGKYGHVVLDSPPVLAVTDATVLGAQADGVVMVLRSGETEQKAAERAVDQLRRIGVRIFGAVLNEVAASTPEESYYLKYYYSYRSGPRKRSSGWRKTIGKATAWMG